MAKLNAVAQIQAGVKELTTQAKQVAKLERMIERKDALIEKLKAKLSGETVARKPRQAKVEEEAPKTRRTRKPKAEQVEEVKKPRRQRKVKAEEVEEAPKARRTRKAKAEKTPAKVEKAKTTAKAKKVVEDDDDLEGLAL